MNNALSLGLLITLAAVAVPAFADNSDPGASGVVDGSDVQSFFGSGFIPDPQKMEEASIPFDKAINIPWREKRIPLQHPDQPQGGNSQSANMQTGNSQSANNQTDQSSGQQSGKKKKKKKKGFFGTVGGALSSTANFLGFPVGEDNDVDATLASDLALPQQQQDDQRTVQTQMRQSKDQKNQP